MTTRVCIYGLTADKVEHIDRLLGGTSWRLGCHGIRESESGIYDVDVSNNCDVLYVSNDTATNAIVLSVGNLTAGITRNEFNSILAR